MPEGRDGDGPDLPTRISIRRYAATVNEMVLIEVEQRSELAALRLAFCRWIFGSLPSSAGVLRASASVMAHCFALKRKRLS
jgi:hypothetical protein